MRKIIYSLVLTAILTSCGVPQSELDKLKTENEGLKKELTQMQNELETLKEKKQAASMHTEAEALKLLKDYYDFYNADEKYRNPRLRRVDNNTFKISLEWCFKEHLEMGWQSSVLTLTINDDGTYKMNHDLP